MKRNKKKQTSKEVLLPCFLAWLLPGLGHWYLGRKKIAVLIFVLITGGFFLGCYLNGDIIPPLKEANFVTILTLIGHFFNGLFSIGTLLIYGETGKIMSETYEIGKTFIDISCLLNILMITNIYTIVKGLEDRET